MRTAIAIFLVGCSEAAAPVPEVDAGPDTFVMSDGGDTDAAPLPDAAVTPDADVTPGMDAAPLPDAGATPDAAEPDAGPDTSTPDAGPPDTGPPDVGPPDSGPPDAGPACVGRAVSVMSMSSTAWTRTEMTTAHPVLELQAGLHTAIRYRLGLRVTAADPRARITVIVTGCPTTVQTCADQNDIDRKIPFPAPGHDGCQVTGIGSATMGLSCAFDDPPTMATVIVDHDGGTMTDTDPAFCRPAFTAEAFTVADPSRPSAF